jgi:hypothetical protein
MWVMISVVSIIFFLSHLFVFSVLKDEFKKGKNPFFLILGNLTLGTLLASSIIAVGLLLFLTFKGVSYVFGHVIIFDNNMTIFTVGLAVCLMYVLLSFTLHAALSAICKHFFQNKAHTLVFYCIGRIAIDSTILYQVLLAIPGVELRNPYIAIFIATLFFIPDLFASPKKKKTYEENA